MAKKKEVYHVKLLTEGIKISSHLYSINMT